MATIGIEVVDAAVTVVRDGVRLASSPGIALLDPAGVVVGEAAAAAARLQPVLASDRFWSDLAQDSFAGPIGSRAVACGSRSRASHPALARDRGRGRRGGLRGARFDAPASGRSPARDRARRWHPGRRHRGFRRRRLRGTRRTRIGAASRRAVSPGRAHGIAGCDRAAPSPRGDRAARRAQGHVFRLGATGERSDGAPHALRSVAPGRQRTAALSANAGLARRTRRPGFPRRRDRDRGGVLRRDASSRAVHARRGGLVRADRGTRAWRPSRRRVRDARPVDARGDAARARRAARLAAGSRIAVSAGHRRGGGGGCARGRNRPR